MERRTELRLRFEPMLNLKVAQAIGVAFPQTLRLRADRVIE